MQWSDLFDKSIPFEAWGSSHLWAMAIGLGVGLGSILYARSYLDRAGQKKLLFCLAIIPFVAVVMHSIIKIGTGTFDVKTDLPVHLCRLLALVSPIVYWKENKFWLGIFYFWIIVGTLNAVLTPDVYYDFPHWEHPIYFIKHVGLVILPLYYILVLGHRIRKVDLWNAYWMSNLFLFLSLIINFMLESNYMFTRHKPLVPTLLDPLGPWPWYLVFVQFLALGLFVLVYVPFWVGERRLSA